MATNLDRYKSELDALLIKGEQLNFAMQYECDPDGFKKIAKEQLKDKAEDYLNKLPSFRGSYQAWYSEAKALVRQLLPDRIKDFSGHYEKPTPRKELTAETYRVEDYLIGVTVTRGHIKVVGHESAIPHFRQQQAILESVKLRFESSLFDIRQLVQADLFDSELDAARALAKHGFARAAGALAGVVLERHLAQVCVGHALKISKKNPGIADLSEALKESGVVDLPQWRFVQHLADIRNLCDHNKTTEPTIEQVDDLLAGVAKVIKTIF